MIDEAFEWDEVKSSGNYVKHGLAFETARRAFLDPTALDWLDDRRDYGEDRYILLGMCDSRLFYVAYTLRDQRIRIISARGADAAEQRLYREYHG